MSCFFCLVRLYNRLFYKKLPKQKISTSHLPWLWIGAKLNDGKIETITDIVNSSVDHGDVITPNYLQSLTQIDNVNRWVYLDSRTLFEEEFPTEGLVIKDDSNK